MRINLLEYNSDNKVTLSYSDVSLWVYEVLGFSPKYSRTLVDDDEYLSGLDGSQSNAEKAKIFMIAIVEEAITNGMDILIANKRFTIGEVVSMNLPKLIQLVDDRNDDPFIKQIIKQFNYSTLSIIEKREVIKKGELISIQKFSMVMKMLKFQAKHTYLQPEYLIQFNNHKEDSITCSDLVRFRPNSDGHAVHVMSFEQRYYDRVTKTLSIQNFPYWYMEIFCRLRIGGGRLIDVVDCPVEPTKTKDEIKLGLKRLILKDVKGVNMTVFELWRIFDIPLRVPYNNKSAVDYVLDNKTVDLTTLVTIVEAYLRDIDKDPARTNMGAYRGNPPEDIYPIREIVRKVFFIHYAIFKLLKETHPTADFRMKRYINNGNDFIDKRWLIKTNTHIPLPTTIAQEDATAILSCFKDSDTEIYDYSNRPLQNGVDDFCSVVEYYMYLEGIKLYQGELRGAKLRVKLRDTFKLLKLVR